jgi:hypothetical protein
MVALVLAGGSTIFAYFWGEAVRIQYHVHGMQRADHILDVLAGKVPQARRDRVTRMLGFPDTNSHWADTYAHHRDTLIRLGYLTRQEFPFSPGTFTVDELLTNALLLMSDGTASFSLPQGKSVVQVVARPAEMSAWAVLIGELERRHRP